MPPPPPPPRTAANGNNKKYIKAILAALVALSLLVGLIATNGGGGFPSSSFFFFDDDEVPVVGDEEARAGRSAAARGDVDALAALASRFGGAEEGRRRRPAALLYGARDDNGWNALHEAVRGGHVPAADYLLREGLDMNERTHYGMGGSPLWWARKTHGNNHRMVEYLVSVGAEDLPPVGGGGRRGPPRYRRRRDRRWRRRRLRTEEEEDVVVDDDDGGGGGRTTTMTTTTARRRTRRQRPPPPTSVAAAAAGVADDAAPRDAMPPPMPPPPPPPHASSSGFDPGSYAYLIVHYHKTGHHLSRQLRDFLVDGTDGGAPVSDGRENAFQHRMHERETGCPRSMVLNPGVVSVQAAPDFFCDAPVLAEYLLRSDDATIGKRGVKVVHLVRDPFSLAVSNWIYHAQYPTPELWVKSVDPCAEELWFGAQAYRDLVGPTLLSGDDPIMRRGDFDAIRGICAGLYRSTEESRESKREWSYYTHLRHLDPESALSMATTHMLGQGMTGGDIVRMASNVVKLRQVMMLEDKVRLAEHVVPDESSRMIQVMTLSMEEFTREPRAATIRFLDFALADSSPPEVKERIASEYEMSYIEKVKKGDEHITADKKITNGKYGGDMNIVEKKESLEMFLREHELFGRVLGNIERLINDALLESGVGGTLH